MRILFVIPVFRSHLLAQVPLAWALRTAGHDVRVAGPPDIIDDIANTGLPGISIGERLDIEEKMTQAGPVYAQMPPADPRGKETGRSLNTDFGWGDPQIEYNDFIGGIRAAFFPDPTIDDLLSVSRLWRPDLVISDPTCFPAALAARVAGAAHARQLFAVDRLAQVRAALLARHGFDDPLKEWLDPILARDGFEFDETVANGHWTISPLPTWINGVEGVHYLPMRRIPFNGPSITPKWVYEPPARRRVCLTLGITHRDANIGDGVPIGELLNAVADFDVEVVATLNAKQLETVSKVPDNVRTVDFVPLNALLPSCSAIVHEGGGGAFASAIENGVPQIIVPQDFTVEKWCGPLAIALGLEERGAGVYAANASHLTAEILRHSLKLVLEDPSFAENAARLRTEVTAMPSPNDMVPVLEKLTAEFRRS